MLEHGGQLRLAAAHYNIPLADWLDLSTGINPEPWPVPALPSDVWQRLPESGDGLEAAAAAYYGNPNLLPVAGSQAAIQRLPTLLPRAAVACISPLYSEHPQAWQQAGHKLRFLQNAVLPRALAAMTPYVLLCNPNNPTADRHPQTAVIEAAQQLKKRAGRHRRGAQPDRVALAGQVLRPGRGARRLHPGRPRPARPDARSDGAVDRQRPGPRRGPPRPAGQRLAGRRPRPAAAGRRTPARAAGAARRGQIDGPVRHPEHAAGQRAA